MKFTALTLSALVALMSVSATPAPLGERSIEERQWNVSESIVFRRSMTRADGSAPCGGDQVVSVKVGGYIGK